MRSGTNPEYIPEEWLGQIRAKGQWVDFARGTEASSRRWQAEDPANRRVLHWINRAVLVPHEGVTSPDSTLDATTLLQTIATSVINAEVALADEHEGEFTEAVNEVAEAAEALRKMVAAW